MYVCSFVSCTSLRKSFTIYRSFLVFLWGSWTGVTQQLFLVYMLFATLLGTASCSWWDKCRVLCLKLGESQWTALTALLGALEGFTKWDQHEDKFIWIENARTRHGVCWSREQWGKSQLVAGRSRWISWVQGQLCLCSVLLSQDYMWDPFSKIKKNIKLGENNKFYKWISNTMDRDSIFFIFILFTY